MASLRDIEKELIRQIEDKEGKRLEANHLLYMKRD